MTGALTAPAPQASQPPAPHSLQGPHSGAQLSRRPKQPPRPQQPAVAAVRAVSTVKISSLFMAVSPIQNGIGGRRSGNTGSSNSTPRGVMCNRNAQDFFLQHISFSQRLYTEQVVCFSNAIQLRAPLKEPARMARRWCRFRRIFWICDFPANRYARGATRSRRLPRSSSQLSRRGARLLQRAHRFGEALRQRVGAVQPCGQGLPAADDR